MEVITQHGSALPGTVPAPPAALATAEQPRPCLYERAQRAPLIARTLRAPFVQRALRPTRGTKGIHKFIRYSMVSAVAIVISQTTILICAWIFGLSGITANTIGAMAAVPASYQLNRKWAWGKTGPSHLWREIAPFWMFTVIGWLASTGTVQLADHLAKTNGMTGLPRALAIMGASLFAYGVVWTAKFAVLNWFVFTTPTGPAPQLTPANLPYPL